MTIFRYKSDTQAVTRTNIAWINQRDNLILCFCGQTAALVNPGHSKKDLSPPPPPPGGGGIWSVVKLFSRKIYTPVVDAFAL